MFFKSFCAKIGKTLFVMLHLPPLALTQEPWYMLSCLWDDAATERVAHVAAGFFLLSLFEWSFTICPT